MKAFNIVVAAALLLAAGCNIQFASPEFPKDTEPDVPLKFCGELEGLCVGPDDEFERNQFGCPWGYEPAPVSGCGPKGVCCVVSENCDSAGVVFSAQGAGVGCCPWLGSRDLCDVTGFEDCECLGEEYICTDCGDWQCEPWENSCNCPEDCGEEPPPPGCDPWGFDGSFCPDGSFCAAPPYACEVGGIVGECIPLNATCSMIFEPVCSCNHNDYNSVCEAHQASENVAWFGPCEVEDSECFWLGDEIGAGVPSSVKCCGDLDKVKDAALNTDLCTPMPGYVCVKCGDGICGPGENVCICNDCQNFGPDEPEPGGG